MDLDLKLYSAMMGYVEFPPFGSAFISPGPFANLTPVNPL